MGELDKNNDHDLVALSLKDSSNFSILIQRYEKKFFRYINRLCACPREDIEDLIQEIFIKIYRNLNEFDQKLKFSSWAYRIAHNEVISHYRKINSRPHIVNLEPDLAISDKIKDDFATFFDRNLNKGKVLEILATLDLRYKEILVLRFFEEKSYEEISDILRKPPGTVATLLNRAKKQFREKTNKLKIEF
ncbi:MAG: RNA polymerase sigma factor [Candidatus Berkelbacteria bacterium]